MALESAHLKHKKGTVTLSRLQLVVPHKHGYITYFVFFEMENAHSSPLCLCTSAQQSLWKLTEASLRRRAGAEFFMGISPQPAPTVGAKKRAYPQALSYAMLACGTNRSKLPAAGSGPLSSLHVWKPLQPLKRSSTCFRATGINDESGYACTAQEGTMGALEATGAGSGMLLARGWTPCFPALALR